MSGFSVRVTGLVALALSLLGSIDAAGSAENYTGTVCKDYVNYQVWVPPNINIAAIEASLIKEGIVEQSLKSIPDNCLKPFMELVCSTNFPRAEPSSQPNDYDVKFACKSTCHVVATQCSSIFTTTGKEYLVPDCNGIINGTAQLTLPSGLYYQPDGSCNRATNLSPISTDGNGTGTGHQTRCPLPFIPDTMQGLDGGSTNPDVCSSGCCLPCPAQYSLYPTGSLEIGFDIAIYARIASTVLSLFLLLSSICLPDKLSHPSILVFCHNICIFLFSVVVFFPLADRRGIQCIDAINPSTQQNNPLCAVQGTILVFASIAICTWCAAIILNLHLHAVWSSAWFARNYTITHTLCWGLPTVITVIVVALGGVQWTTGSYCFVAQKIAVPTFFYPLGVIIFPAFLIHVWTFIHIARVTTRSAKESSSASRSTLTGGSTPGISHYRHVKNIIRIQWRAALMASLAIIIVILYWLFYFLQLGKMEPEVIRPNVENYFIKCIVAGGDQDTCAKELAPYLPPYLIMIVSEVLTSSVGITLFIMFYRPALIHEWGELFRSIGYFLSGKGRRKDEDEFIPM